jgi:hypothetical protein
VLLVYSCIVALVLVFCFCPSSVRVVTTFPVTVLFHLEDVIFKICKVYIEWDFTTILYDLLVSYIQLNASKQLSDNRHILLPRPMLSIGPRPFASTYLSTCHPVIWCNIM